MNTTAPSPPPKTVPPRWRRVWTRLTADRGPGKKRLWVLIAIPSGVVALLGVIALVALYAAFAKGLPSIDWALHYRPPIVTNVISGDQQLMGEFYDERRVVVPYERVPKKLVQAFIASEDADFFDHSGVSYTGLLRGLYQTYVKRARIVGGSTLSQQTAKAIIASAEGAKAVRIRSGWAGVRRKVREFILTRRLESNFTKEQILNLYLNEVYLGHHSYGVQAAAENYFRKNVWELTLPEMALIAGLPQAPSKYSPFAYPERAKARRAYVLRRMFEEGMISAAQRAAADAAPIEVYPVQDIFRETAPYVTEHVRRDVVARYGNQRLLQDGLQIFTTVDLEREHDAIAATLKGVVAPGDVVLVRATENKGEYALEQEPKLQGALISLDPNSGYVLAMIGGYDFEKSEFNRAFQACRQPGSAFKPIIYSAAIEQRGFTPSTILLDAPMVTDDESTGKRWKPNNYDEAFQGEVPVRKALIHSLNTPAIRTLQQVGVKAAGAWAHKLGITTKINEDLSMALGSSCVYLWDLTQVFTLFNRMGQRPHPIFIRRVLDRDGRILEDHSSFYDPWTTLPDRIASGYAKLFEPVEQVIQPETAFLMHHLMEEVCKPPGTGGRAAALGKPVAGKTGTTNDLFDAWFMGYTKDLVTGVWVGYDTYEVPMDKYETGGHTALPIWLDYMQRALKGVPQPQFDPPTENIVWVSVDPETAKRATDQTRQPVLEAYLKGTEPPDETQQIATPNGAPPPSTTAAQEALIKGL